MGVSLFFTCICMNTHQSQYRKLYGRTTCVAVPKIVGTHGSCVQSVSKTENLDSEASRLSRTSRKTIHLKKTRISGISTKKTPHSTNPTIILTLTSP